MKTEKCLSTILVVCFMIASFASVPLNAADAQSKIRIGVYDSRFVALAFYRAENMKKVRDFMESLNLELQKAKEANDEKKVKELEAKGPAFQNLMHQQVFGNLSIPNVMGTIKDQLPAIAKKMGTSLIVSKWEISYSGPEIETVDLTLQLVGLFTVDDATRKMIEEGFKQNQEPVPVDQLLNPYD
jgi:Skp family chaperone for outer membrane proteins